LVYFEELEKHDKKKMTLSISSTKRRRRRTFAAALAGLVFSAAAVMTLSVMMLYESHYFPTQYESAKDYLPTFVKNSDGGGATHSAVDVTNETLSNSTAQTKNNTSDECFSLNSKSWLKGPRLGNAPLASDEAALNLILTVHNMSSILEQTLCHQDSRFLNWNDIDVDDEASFDIAALRLVYLAFHVHQHEPAWNEARHRQEHCSSNDLLQYNIRNMDYECPNTKFLVVPLGEAGLGAVMRLTVVNALLAGMATGRVVMFVNNANTGPPLVRKPWPHASCQRHDVQCFFLASTPCVLTEQELQQAHVLERSEMRSMFRHGEISGTHRIVVSKINTRPHMAPPHLRENLVAIVKKYILSNQDHAALLERAAELIYEIEPLEDSRYYYFGHSSKVHHGAVFYAMRPRPEYVKLLNEIVEDSLPNDFNPDISLGLPIRGECTVYMILSVVASPCHLISHTPPPAQVLTSVWPKANVSRLNST